MKPLEIRYETTIWVPGGEPEVRSLTAEEFGQIDVQLFDHMLASVSGKYGYRDADGEWIERSLDGCGMGKTCLRIVHALQLHPGVFLSPRDIAALVGNRKLTTGNTLAGRLVKIRAAHGENRDDQRFFLSRRGGGYALKWAEFSWIWIDRIPNRIAS